MYPPLISIITPCYNAAPYLIDAIESVLVQSYPNFEWIIINDGSTDDSESIILSYLDKRIKYFKQKNLGNSVALNKGISLVTGDYVKFFDADDIMNPLHLEAQLNRLNGRMDVIASCAWGRFYDNNPNSAKFIPESVWCDMDSKRWIQNALSQKSDMMAGWVWLIPKTIIDRVGGFEPTLSLNNDFEFSIRLLLAVKEVLFTPDAKIYYRTSNSSLSQSASEDAYEAAIRSTDLGCSYLLQLDNSRFMKELCANRYQEWLYRIYPYNSNLQQILQERINALGGSSKSMEGGLFLSFLSYIFGWRFAKKMKILFNRLF
jgi:glycosyltransferase involved in cell wall biosynthesis